jgi:hypothetical protein
MEALAEVLATLPAVAVQALAASLPSAAAVEIDASGRRAAAELAKRAAGWPPLMEVALRLALRLHAALPAGEAAAAAAVAELAWAELRGAPEIRPITAPAAPTPPDAAPEPASLSLEPLIADTAHASLFWLLNPIVELGLPELLWKACLPEGAVLGHAFLPWVAEDDAAPLLLAGGALPQLAVSDEQQREVAVELLAALAAALPWRGLATLPPLELRVAGHLLVASAEGSALVLFAWPAADVAEGVRQLVAHWPASAALSAPPGLASVDPSGRVRPRALTHAPRLPGEGPLAALLAQVAGAPAQLFASRIGEAAAGDDFAARWFGRRGRLEVGPEQLDIVLPSSSLDVRVRHAGIDRDPGWLAWLRLSARFRYTGGETIEIKP